MALFAEVKALSTLMEEPLRFVLETWLPEIIVVVVVSALSTLIDEFDRFVEL